MSTLTSHIFDSNTAVEDIIAANPATVRVMMEYQIRCLQCGEPIWGSIGQAMDEKGFNEETRRDLMNALRALLPDVA